MSQVGSDSESAIGRGTRRKKLAGFLKSANELRQSYQQSYGLGPQRDGGGDYDDSGIPGAFPDVGIARSADEEMLLFPSYARRHSPRKAGNRDLPGSLHDTREHERPHSTGYVHQEWDRYEETNSIVDVDVRGWVYSPQKGQLSRYNRAMIALARRMSGIPAPSSSRASSPNSSHHLRVEARAARHEQELVDKEAESIQRKGEGERHVASHGGYSEAPGRRVHEASSQSGPTGSMTSSPRHPEDLVSGKSPNPLEKTSAYEDDDDAPGPGSLAKRASWNQPADMTSAQLSVANAHMMLRLRPFLTTPLTSTPLTVFFYNEKTSRSRTTYTNEAGHFQLRAALDFVPTSVRVLASERLSATEDVLVTEPHGVSLISDVDDTIKHSAIGAGAREVFRNVFIRDLGDLRIDGVKEWYAKMASMGVQMHYVSNMPWQLFPVLSSFLSGAGLPKGSFHLKHYTGMLQGIFEPVAERKKGTLERIMSDFPQRRFILVGDSGEADLELYTDIVEANPGRVLGVFIRDVTTKPSQGFFDPATNGERTSRPANRSSVESPSTRSSYSSTKLPDHFEPRPELPPRQQTRSSSTLKKAPPNPPMGKLIDYEDDEPSPPQMKRSMTDYEIPRSNQHATQANHALPPHIHPKPASLRSLHPDRKPAPPLPPKPRRLSASSSHKPPSPLSRTQQPSLPPTSNPTSNSTSNPTSTPIPNPTSKPPTPLRPPLPSTPSTSYSYRTAARSKISSVYNALPSLYPTDQLLTTQPGVPSSSSSSHHYMTSSTSSPNGSSSNNNADSNGGEDVVFRSKKEELWLQRWARAKRVLDERGVVLRAWRVGGDVRGECVRLVEGAFARERERERERGEEKGEERR